VTLLPGLLPKPDSSGEWIVDLRHTYHKMRGEQLEPADQLRRLKPHSRAVFFRSLAALYAAGVRIDRALRLLDDQADDASMGYVSFGLAGVVAAGAPLSKAMAAWPEVFSPMQQQLVKMGEATGRLSTVLERLASFEERSRQTGMRVTTALAYPMMLFVLALAGLVIIPPYLLGGMVGLIEGSGVQVPVLTRLMLGFSRVVASPWLWLVLALAAPSMVRTCRKKLRDREVRLHLAELAARVPVVGATLRVYAATRFARALEMPLAIGLPLEQALEMAVAAADDPLLTHQLPAAQGALTSGRTLADSLGGTGCFTTTFVSMLRVGEESGRLPELLAKIADLYELELEQSLEAALAALEPCMLASLGVVVGTMILATVLPLSRVLERL
jgi:type II secretory pathway component PulF